MIFKKNLRRLVNDRTKCAWEARGSYQSIFPQQFAKQRGYLCAAFLQYPRIISFLIRALYTRSCTCSRHVHFTPHSLNGSAISMMIIGSNGARNFRSPWESAASIVISVNVSLLRGYNIHFSLLPPQFHFARDHWFWKAVKMRLQKPPHATDSDLTALAVDWLAATLFNYNIIQSRQYCDY